MRRLTRTDAEYLDYDPQYMSVTLLRFSPRPTDVTRIVERMRARGQDVVTRIDAHPVLYFVRQRIRPVPFNLALPYWEDDPEFDMSNHVTPYRTEGPFPVARAGELLVDSMSRPMDLDRPPWRIEVVDFDDDSFGLLATHHHAAADGSSGYAALALSFLDFTPETQLPQLVEERWIPEQSFSDNEAITIALRDRAAELPAALARATAVRKKDLEWTTATIARIATYFQHRPPATKCPPRTHTIEDRKAWRIYEYRHPLLDLRLTSRAFDATITVLLLTAVAAAWRAVDPEATSVWVLVPVSLHGSDASATNAVAYVIVEVPCGQDPISTLRAADANMARVKGQGQAQAIVDIAKVKTMLPGPLQIGSLGREDRADVVVSNMPGYSFPIWCEGGKLIDALATGSLCFPPYFNKMTFITFEDVVYGTMLEDNGPDGGGAEFDREFRTSLEQLCHIGRMRSLIGRQPHFVALSRSDLDRLSLAAEPVTFEAGDAVVTAGAPADSYFVIESGHATVIIDGAPNRTLGPGHSVGEAGILRDGLSAATVMASEHLVAYRIDKAAFVAAFKGDPLNLQPAEIIMEDYLYEPAE